jgi:16S rRNA (uracil1498-N3)-methyltransferase
VATARTQTDRVNLERLNAIAVAAAEQCGRLTVPPVAALRPLPAVLDAWDPAMRLLVAAERRTAPALAPGDGDALLVGPEGGFDPHELDAMLRRPFVAAVSLGPRILRAETACLAGLAILGAAGPT